MINLRKTILAYFGVNVFQYKNYIIQTTISSCDINKKIFYIIIIRHIS